MQEDGPAKIHDYELESATKTLQIGRVLAAVMIPSFVYLIFADHLVGLAYVLPWRLAALIPAVVFMGLSFRWLPRRPHLTVRAHAFLLLGLMTNVTGMVFSVFRHRHDMAGTEHALMAGLVLVIFVVLIFAAGARRHVGAITVLPMIALAVGFALHGTLKEHEWSYLLNPVMAVAAVTTGGFLQDRMARREFSARRLAEERRDALETTAAELKRSNEELQHFASVVSHDLRAPLATLSIFMGVLQARLKDLGVNDTSVNESVHHAVNGARQMNRMIEALLDYARLGSQKCATEGVDLVCIMEEVRLNLHGIIENSRAAIHVSPLPVVCADRSRMVQLFQNLVGNAIKYAQSGVRPEVAISCTTGNGWHHISVRDNGIGFEAKNAERIFAILFRVDPHGVHEGVGIGLAICRRIVDEMGGRIWAESEPGVGSTFHLMLPAKGGACA